MASLRTAFVAAGFSRAHAYAPIGHLTNRSTFLGLRSIRPFFCGVARPRCFARSLHASLGSNSDQSEDNSPGPPVSLPGENTTSRLPSTNIESGIQNAGGNAGGIVSSDLRKEMSRSYMEYAMSVILGRALPDIRDGLKPVHRRILFAMHGLGIGSTSPYRKCARVVGEVLGKYHPHGDTAVYDALVRMAQDFSMGSPLIDGHGNFGSTDGDPAAAMRYTECRLSSIARDAFLDDLEKDTVTFATNFDGSEKEPLVLPATIPNLLANGSSGIAVGMATSIPPHNLGELVRALLAILKTPDIEDSDLLSLVPAPDFPTGGQILGTDGSRELYLTGRGRVLMRAKAHFEVLEGSSASGRRSSREAVIVTELPYQVNKATLVAKIAELVNDKKLDGIADLRDESDRNGTRIVIELKRDAERAVVLNNLYKRTALQHAFSGNMLALDNGLTPLRFSLREYLCKFLDFRRNIVRKRTAYELARAQARMHLVLGFLIAQESIDGVVATIKGSGDVKSAQESLRSKFNLSSKQADAVLSMQLRRLTGLERGRLEAEAKSLEKSIADFSDVLEKGSRVDEIIMEELEKQGSKHAVPRRSVIVQGQDLDAAEIDELSLVSNDQCVIVMTQQGYIKRMLSNEFESQNRGTRGKRGVGNTRDKDVVAHFFSCKTHDMLLAISKRGIAYGLSAHKVPIGSRTSRGTPIFQLLSDEAISAGETMASVLPVPEFGDDEYLALLTKNGSVKKTALSAFESMNSRGKIAITLQDGDELKWVRRCVKTDSMIIASRSGKAVRIGMDEATVRASGRMSIGVRSMRMAEGDEIADMDILHGMSEDEDVRYMLAVTSDGLGKRVEAREFRKMRRGCVGVLALKFKPRSGGRLLALQTCNENDSVMLVTKQGTIVRQAVGSITARSRLTRPVLMQRLDKGDEVAAVTILPPELAGGDDEDEDDADDEDDNGEAYEAGDESEASDLSSDLSATAGAIGA